MHSESSDKNEQEKKFSLEQLKFYKSVKYKMLTSFVIGIVSGFLAGVVALLMLFSYVGDIPIPPSTVTILIVFSIASLAFFIWGLVRSLKARIT
jgi:ABC-type multidrug transport system permease subunit